MNFGEVSVAHALAPSVLLSHTWGCGVGPAKADMVPPFLRNVVRVKPFEVHGPKPDSKFAFRLIEVVSTSAVNVWVAATANRFSLELTVALRSNASWQV